jgi:glycosyltransferase involved in cell wall biosynthesis
MSYAPIQSETTLIHQIPVEGKSSVHRNKSARTSSLSTRKTNHRRRCDAAEPNRLHPIIVHCHLCWDWVWQRPQQFLSRLSQKRKVLFVETVAPDPELGAPLSRFRKLPEFPNITLLRLQFPGWRWDDADYVDQERRRLVQEFVESPAGKDFVEPIQWFYDPMAVPSFAGHMGEVLTVYDCMDELSKFRGAPPRLVERELDLLERADLVFTGGRRLFENKSQFHDNCHFYGCGVEVEHFGKARAAQTVVPPEMANLRQPVLGYFGVIDERMDYELVAHLADARPDWSVVMIGPMTKVDPKTLPQAANLHWLGQRAYADLPAFCKGFDLCLMPFALNEATEYINPTKALEYMATGREIISTAVHDVVHNFGSVAKIARTREEFVLLCESALDQPDAETIGRGLRMAQQNSWNSIVTQLEGHLAEALQLKRLERDEA